VFICRTRIGMGESLATSGRLGVVNDFLLIKCLLIQIKCKVLLVHSGNEILLFSVSF
jgi:hypothetical protein